VGLTLRDIDFTHSPGTPFATRALTGVSVDVSAGELVLVVGATGSGKSTLLRIAAGLLAPDSGSAELDGITLTAGTARGRVGLAFQNPEQQLFADTVLDDVAFGPRNLGLSHDDALVRAEDALAAVGIDVAEFGERSPFTLSGGEARRVALAGVLAMQPACVLLDEPSAGLDARGRDALLVLLARVRAEAGVIVVSHDAEDLLRIADRVLVLAEGRPVFYGSADALVADPSPFERASLLAPEVLRVQQFARARGIDTGPFTLAEDELAARLLAAREAKR